MPSGVEHCACGAEIEISEAHYTQVVAFITTWRKQHVCNAQPSTEVNIISVDASRNETPMGFTRGMRTETGDPEPLGDDPEERRRK